MNTSLRDRILNEVVALAYDGGSGGLDNYQYMDMCVEITEAVLAVLAKEET